MTAKFQPLSLNRWKEFLSVLKIQLYNDNISISMDRLRTILRSETPGTILVG